MIAGIVGGKKSGSLGNAILAVFSPAILFGFILFFMATILTSIPILGAIAGAGGLILSLAHVGPLLLGTIIGGFFSKP